MIKQIHAARKFSLNGIIIFDYAHLTDDYIKTLTQSIYRPLYRDASNRGVRRSGRR